MINFFIKNMKQRWQNFCERYVRLPDVLRRFSKPQNEGDSPRNVLRSLGSTEPTNSKQNAGKVYKYYALAILFLLLCAAYFQLSEEPLKPRKSSREITSDFFVDDTVIIELSSNNLLVLYDKRKVKVIIKRK